MQDVASRHVDPGPGVQGLVRGRLDSAILTAPVPRICLVTAPAGSGKTTLLTHIASAAQCSVAWIHARPEDRSEEDVIPRLVQALGSFGPQHQEPGDVRNVTELLVSLGSARAPILILIDDLHEVAGGGAEAAIGRLILHAPTQIRFVIATRRPPAFDVSRLLASGDMVQLGGDDLRFRSWETEDLFRTVYGEPLSPEAAAMLSRRLGGWAAGMQLFHLSVRDRSRTEREAGVAELTGRCKLIRSYLSRNVVNGLPPERRDFLLRTSVLGVLTGRLCDALLGSTGSERVLRDLEREHFFTSSEDGQTYVYHQVLRNHLEVTLAEEMSDQELRALLYAAGNLLEAAGHVQASARAFAQAGDWASVGRVIQQSRSLVALDVDWACASSVAAPAAPDDPWLALARARRLFQRGSIDDAVAAFRQVEEVYDDPEARQRCATERSMAAMLLPRPSDHTPARTELHRILSGTRAMTRRIPPYEEEAPDSTTGEGLVQGLGLLLSGAWDHAEQRLLRAAAASDPRSWERLAVGIVDAILECRDRSAADPTGPLEEISLAADVQGHPWLARVARGVQASVVVVREQERWRLDSCRDLSESCRRDSDRWGELIVSLGSAIAAHRIGEDEAGSEFLRSAGGLAEALDAPVLALWVKCIEEAGRESRGEAGSPTRWQRLARTAVALGVEDFEGVCRVVRNVPAPRPQIEPLFPTGDGAVTVRCLGSFAIETPRGNVDLTGLRPKARTLLMALAVDHQHDVHRERLEEMLWPGAEAGRAKHSLQVAVSSVRRVLAEAGLGSATVQRRGDAYRLQIDDATLDTTLFEGWVRRTAWDPPSHASYRGVDQATAVLDLYRGDLLPEVGYADWVVLERDRMRQIAADYAVRVAQLCLRLHRHGSGITAARRALELDQYQDSGWIVLTQLHEGAGDYTAAAFTRARHGDIRRRLDVQAPLRPAQVDAAHERVSGFRQMR